jgi:hypothetical protein
MTSPAARLRRLAAALPALGDDGVWLAAGLQNYLSSASDGAQLADVLQLTPPPGGESWWRAERRQQRDEALRELARQTGASMAEIAALVSSYASDCWPRDRALSSPPSRYAGTPKRWLFLAFQAGEGRVPESEKQLGRIIGRWTPAGAFHVPAPARTSGGDE